MKAVCILVVSALVLTIPIFLWSAEEGPALYETNCSVCHGVKGEGNADTEMPKIIGTPMTLEELTAYITKGDEQKMIHASPIEGLNEDQAKLIAAHVKSLKDQ